MAVRDPYARKYFRLEIDGVSPGGFESAQGLSWETEVLEFQEGGRNDALVRLPGQGRLGKVTLVRGYMANHDLAGWAKDAAAGRSVRRTVDVVVLDDAGEEAARYTLLRAWPTRYEVKELSSQQGHAVDTVELAHEGIVKGARSPGPQAANVVGMLGAVSSALAAAEQGARDRARAARQVADAAEAAAQAAGAAAGVANAVAGAAAAVDAGGHPLTPFLPAPPAMPAGASPLDAAFVASASAGGGRAAGRGQSARRGPRGAESGDADGAGHGARFARKLRRRDGGRWRAAEPRAGAGRCLGRRVCRDGYAGHVGDVRRGLVRWRAASAGPGSGARAPH